MEELKGFLEMICKRILTEPESVGTVVVGIVAKDGTVETAYSNDDMMHKLLVSGIINQDAMFQAISANADDEEENADA